MSTIHDMMDRSQINVKAHCPTRVIWSNENRDKVDIVRLDWITTLRSMDNITVFNLVLDDAHEDAAKGTKMDEFSR